MRRWRQSVARAFHFALVAAGNMGVPRTLCRRTNRELAATRIATTFRAHCCTLRVRSRLLHTKLSIRAAEAMEREQAVILTQQFARGWLARHNGERRQRSLYAIAIEKFVRGNRGRAIARRARARQAAAVRLQASVRARAIARALGPRRAYRRSLSNRCSTCTRYDQEASSGSAFACTSRAKRRVDHSKTACTRSYRTCSSSLACNTCIQKVCR